VRHMGGEPAQADMLAAFLQQALIVWEKQNLEIVRERLRPAAWLISVGFGTPTWQHFVTWYL
jgi:hypothetical protein